MNALVVINPLVDLNEDQRLTVRYGSMERDFELCRIVPKIPYTMFLNQVVFDSFSKHVLLNQACLHQLLEPATYSYQARPP